jgi:hypothetical protein
VISPRAPPAGALAPEGVPRGAVRYAAVTDETAGNRDARLRERRGQHRLRSAATLGLVVLLVAIAVAGGLVSAAVPGASGWLIVLVLALLSGPVAGGLAWLRRDR